MASLVAPIIQTIDELKAAVLGGSDIMRGDKEGVVTLGSFRSFIDWPVEAQI